jgi:hypothetical protein
MLVLGHATAHRLLVVPLFWGVQVLPSVVATIVPVMPTV